MTILVEARHQVRPITAAAFDTYVDFYGNDVVPAMTRHGFELVGAWQRRAGEMGQDLALYRFASLADYERAQVSLAADATLGPIIENLLSHIEMAETTKIGEPLGRAAEQGLERALAQTPAVPRVYQQRIEKLVFSRQARGFELLEQMADFAGAQGLGSVVAAYRTVTGPGPEATQIWLLPDAATPLAYQRGDPLAAFIEPLREVAPEQETCWLSPLPYSPLQ